MVEEKNEDKESVVIHNIKSLLHRCIHSDGILVNNHPTDDELVVLNLYNDQFELSDFDVFTDGSFSYESRSSLPDIKEGNSSDLERINENSTRITREFEATIYVSKQTLEQLIKTLTSFLNYEKEMH